MYLIYFDETKFTNENPYFFIGGILIPDSKINKFEEDIAKIHHDFFGTSVLTKDTEFHGHDIFQGTGIFKRKPLKARLKLFRDVSNAIFENKVSTRIVCIDTFEKISNKEKYKICLTFALEQFSEFLEEKNDIGMVFGDYEKEGMAQAVLDFSTFKLAGKTNTHSARSIERIKDTIYYTHSHHSRFIQVADMVLYMANRYEESYFIAKKWHDVELKQIWQKFFSKTDTIINVFPFL